MRALERKKLLTIIAPGELQSFIVSALRRRGVGGYTVVSATGAGVSGLRSGMLASDSNVVIYVIMSDQRLQGVLQDIDSLMTAGYRLKAIVSDIEILPRKPSAPDQTPEN